MSKPFAHQDASGNAGAPLAIFVNGDWVEYVDVKADPYGEEAIARHDADGVRAEALIECFNHPKQSAVDCVICDPED